MLLLEGYLKEIWIDKASTARGGPGWAIRVTNRNGSQVTFLARSWRVVSIGTDLEGCGGLGDKMLTPDGPSHWVRTRLAIDADIPDLGGAWPQDVIEDGAAARA
jgi:hypothetical protein